MRISLACLLWIPLLGGGALTSLSGAVDDLTVTGSMPIGGEGRWDYVITDAGGKRLFVPRSTHTQVLDCATGTQLADIPNTAGVHGVALAPSRNRGFTSNGGAGTVTIFDLTTYAVLGTVPAAADADCIIADEATHQILIFCGDSGQMFAIPDDVDPAKPVLPAPMELGGKPEFAAADGHGMVYVNIEDKDMVAAIDAKTRTVKARYPLAPGTSPAGMAMDPTHRRLFVGCHNLMLVVLDADTGAMIAHLPIGKGNDATAFRNGLAFASCGDGTLTVVRESSPSDFTVIQTLATMPGARTMAVDPASGRIYMPFAKLGPAPAATVDHPHPRPMPIAGSFALLVVSPSKAAASAAP